MSSRIYYFLEIKKFVIKIKKDYIIEISLRVSTKLKNAYAKNIKCNNMEKREFLILYVVIIYIVYDSD